jgi:FkbM family methyltransferase
MNIISAKVNLEGNERFFSYRPDSVGDQGVIRQIFVNGDYKIQHWEQGKRFVEFYRKLSETSASLIIDAGANIGASAVFFANIYKNSIVFAIEPDITNWHLLSLNTNALNCYNFLGAISSEDGELTIVDPGRSDWGFMTKKVGSSDSDGLKKVESICPASIINHPSVNNAKPLIFKIDIEGGEENLFEGNVDWLKEFPLLIIELHDWMLPFSGSSKNFIRAAAKYDFDILHRGENIFLFNRDIL